MAGHDPLLTDLYQLTMLQGYRASGIGREEAVFELFFRSLPPQRNFLVACGLDMVLDFLETFSFSPADLDWLSSQPQFDPAFVRSLAGLKFSGDVWAMPEGTVFFAGEPVVRVRAPLEEAQLVETRLINLIHFQTLIAAKAARMRLAAPAAVLVDFGLRRCHGGEAGLLAARSAFVAGFDGTSTVRAGERFGIPIYGTMAHSFVQAFAREEEAFLAFARSQPGPAVLLIDTYDTVAAAGKVAQVARQLAAEGREKKIAGVRIDSGDLAALSVRVREILDRDGLGDVRIFVSGNLDEHSIRALAASAPVDGFGVGTRLGTSADAPCLDCVYKLVESGGEPRFKRSSGKATLPGVKQVFRSQGPDGRISDTIALADEEVDGEPLLVPVMRGGRRIFSEGLAGIRERFSAQVKLLPGGLRRLDPAPPLP